MTRTILFFSVFLATTMLGQNVTEPSGVKIGVTHEGTFTIESGAWIYSGTIPGQVNNIAGPESGLDDNSVSKNGTFDEFTVNYTDPDGNPWHMQLRAYRSLPSATISFSPLTDTPNSRPYAILNQFPITPHHFSNAGWNRAFGLVGWMDTDSPWLFFDDQFQASILSAASRPMSQRQVWVYNRGTNGLIALVVDASNPVLTAGGVYSHLITFGQGIGKTFKTWGWTLRNIDGRPLTGNQSDLSMIMPMLSTDAGASYYYSFNPALGYEGTLQAAIASAKAAGIPIGVVHFDSWWYLKGGNCDDPADPSFASWNKGRNGVWKFEAVPTFFPYINPSEPEQGFIQHLGPGMAHGRWIDACSPYRLPAGDAGDVPPVQSVSGNVIVDPNLWQQIADSLKRSGMLIYEQDFLSTNARAANTFDDEKFLSAMAAAMTKDGIFLQFCMPLARHFLEAIQMPSVHTLRVSGDRFGWNHWDSEMYGAIVLNAGGVWPTVDNFQTTETRNLLLAVLSAGPLALSDPIGGFVPIPEAIRNDGLILKPDLSMLPTDATFVAEAAAIEQFYGVNGATASNAGNKGNVVLPPLVGHTYSDFGRSKVEYVFAYSRDVNAPATVSISPQDLGFTGTVYVYDYFGKMGWTQPAAHAIARTVDSQGTYFVIAPVGPSGIAFMGDLSRFATASKQRFPALNDDGRITATMHFAPGETVPLSIFATEPPAVSANGATAGAPAYDPGTGLYQVTLTSQNKEATLHIAPAIAPRH
jgi:hypothetical protein